MSIFFYNLSIFLYGKLIYIISFFNKKADLWIKGRIETEKFHFKEKTIWMHCASLGEFEQGRPLIELLKIEYPQYPIIISFFSPSGYEIRKNYPLANKVIYLPLDTTANAIKIIDSINPAFVIWVKYEFWWHHLAEIKKRNIPVILTAAIFRDSQPFFKWYGQSWRKGIQLFHFLFLQNKTSLELLNSININNAAIVGDTRFDRVKKIADTQTDIPFIKDFINGCKVIVAGSTWEADEKLFTPTTINLKNIKFIIVPHDIHPANIIRLKKNFKNSASYSEVIKNDALAQSTNFLIIDSIGLLSTLYQYANIVYVGGGFGKGIHNILEPAVYGVPVLFGPNHEKFAEAIEMINRGGGFCIKNSIDFTSTVMTLLNNNEAISLAGKNSKDYVLSNLGATEKINAYIKLNRLLTN